MGWTAAYLAAVRIAIALLVWPIALGLQAQSGCSCAAEGEVPLTPDTVFVLDSALVLACCGHIDRSRPEAVYRAFTLRWCGTTWPLLETDATSVFRLRVQEHALVAEDLRMLPEGPDLAMRAVVWRTHVIQGLFNAAVGEPITRISEFPGRLRRLTRHERRMVRTRTETMDRTKPWTDEDLLGLLFLCAAQRASGAEQRFRSLREDHLLDGAMAARYAELVAMLDQLEAER